MYNDVVNCVTNLLEFSQSAVRGVVIVTSKLQPCLELLMSQMTNKRSICGMISNYSTKHHNFN